MAPVIEADAPVREHIHEENPSGIAIVMFPLADEVKLLVRVFVAFLEFNRDQILAEVSRRRVDEETTTIRRADVDALN